nr:VHS domain-containing protein At3g16270 [Ipomoea trifida]
MVSELAGEGAMLLPKPASHAELQVGLPRQIQSSLRSGVDSPFNLSAVLSFQSRVSRSRFVKSLSNVLIIPMFAVFNRSSQSKSVRSSAELVIPLFAVFLRSRSVEILSAELVAVVSSPQRRTRKKNQLLTQIRDFASEKSQGKRRISNLKNRMAVFNRSRVLVNPVFAVFDRDFGSRSSPQRRTREMSAELVNSSLVTIDCSSWSRSIENLSDSRSRSVEILSRVLTACNNNISFSESLTVRPSYDAFAVSSPLPSAPKAPEKDSELYPQWKRCNALITLWILRSYASTVISRVLDAPTHEFQEVQWQIVVGDDDDNVEDVNMLQDANVGVMDAHSFVWNLATVFGEWKSQYLDDSSQHSGNSQSFLDDSQMKDKTEKEDFNKNKKNKIHEANGWKASLTAVMVKALSDVLFGIGTDLNTSEQKNNDDHFADVSFRSSNGKVHEYDPFSELTFDKPRSAEVRPVPSGSGPKSKQDAEKQSQQIKLCTKVPPSSSKRSCYGGSILQLGTKNIDNASQASVCC